MPRKKKQPENNNKIPEQSEKSMRELLEQNRLLAEEISKLAGLHLAAVKKLAKESAKLHTPPSSQARFQRPEAIEVWQQRLQSFIKSHQQ